MAKVALTIGSVVAMAAGQPEIAIALAAAAAMIPAKVPGLEPLQALKVSSSADGAPIPWGYGTGRVAGQVIWSPGITWARSVGRQSKSWYSPIPNPTTATYVYSASFAAAFGEGPATISRLWGDSKLIYAGGRGFGTVSVWNSTTIYYPEDLVSYRFAALGLGGSEITVVFRCIMQNNNVPPAGNSLYWEDSNYPFWLSGTQYFPGNEVVYPGLQTEVAQAGQVYACTKPSLGDHPNTSPAHWQPLQSYYAAPTLYRGDDVQNADPLIQGQEGIGNTPAFRGVCYGVWDNFPLANFGNRVPNLRAEVDFG